MTTTSAAALLVTIVCFNALLFPTMTQSAPVRRSAEFAQCSIDDSNVMCDCVDAVQKHSEEAKEMAKVMNAAPQGYPTIDSTLNGTTINALDNYNITDEVCDLLAVYETAKTLQDTNLTASLKQSLEMTCKLVYNNSFGIPADYTCDVDATDSEAVSDNRISFLHSYCIQTKVKPAKLQEISDDLYLLDDSITAINACTISSPPTS